MRIIVKCPKYLYERDAIWAMPNEGAYVKVGSAQAIWQVRQVQNGVETMTIDITLDAVEQHMVPLNASVSELPRPVAAETVPWEEIIEQALGGGEAGAELLAKAFASYRADAEVWIS